MAVLELDLFAVGEPSLDAFDGIISQIENELRNLSLSEKVSAINRLRRAIHKESPFKAEPVDCVIWVQNEKVSGNDYNPNTVAPAEMKLLHTSIKEDGYTQPIVGWRRPECERNGVEIEVVDGFHRNRIGKEHDDIKGRVMGYLPLVIMNDDRIDKGDRIASTIRHNRARGKHKVEAMSDIVVELKRRNWSDDKISRELGMDADEVLRLCQITGMEELFANEEFSMSWDLKEPPPDVQIKLEGDAPEERESRRIFHTYEKWECHKAGFYENQHPMMTKDDCEIEYAKLLKDEKAFRRALTKVLRGWVISCEHYLSNESMNRIAWLGQAALCAEKGIPSTFRGGFHYLTQEQKDRADAIALEYLNKWLTKHDRPILTIEQAASKTEANLY